MSSSSWEGKENVLVLHYLSADLDLSYLRSMIWQPKEVVKFNAFPVENFLLHFTASEKVIC
jgi:hypothetical protein